MDVIGSETTEEKLTGPAWLQDYTDYYLLDLSRVLYPHLFLNKLEEIASGSAYLTKNMAHLSFAVITVNPFLAVMLYFGDGNVFSYSCIVLYCSKKPLVVILICEPTFINIIVLWYNQF